ncbi:MAG: hypothetical protein OJI67_11680 [Prosthecobacter sp.]|nr:hypothetical protein [Prosthecobacter sp.]
MDLRTHSPRASLGAMSWNVPRDDWESPWSFEDEWIPPDKSNIRKSLANSGEGASSSSAGKDALITDVSAKGMILRFDNEVSDEPPVLPSPIFKPETPPVAELKKSLVIKSEDVRFRPPIELSPVPEKPLQPELPALEHTYKLEPLPEPPRHSVIVEDEPTVSGQRRSIPRRPNMVPWGSMISLCLGTLGFTLIAWIYMHDTPRESDDDLRPRIVIDQTPTTQAPKKLRAFLDSIVPLDNIEMRRQPSWLWDTPTLALFIRSNGTAVDNLRDLLEDYDWHPHHSQWHQEDLSEHPAWIHVAYLLQARAAYLARRGDEEPAFIAAVDLAELSRRLQDVWAWSGFVRRGLELQTSSVQTLAELLKSTRLESSKLARFQDEFTRCQPDDELIQQACAAYYIHEKKLLLGPASGEPLDTMPGGRLHQRPGRLFFKMNETLSLFASAFRDLRDEITRPPYTRLSMSDSPASRIHLTPPRFYHPNSNGESYFSNRLEPHLRLPQDHSLAKARHGLVCCLFALRRYLVDHRTLPKQLNDLTPNYLSSIPRDPFSDEALHYDAAKGLLYSVGVNLIAEGGRVTEPPLDDDREPTVALGIAMATPVKK